MTKTHSRLALMLTFSALTFAACGGPEDAGQQDIVDAEEDAPAAEETAEEAATTDVGTCSYGNARGITFTPVTESECRRQCNTSLADTSLADRPATNCEWTTAAGTRTLINAGSVGICRVGGGIITTSNTVPTTQYRVKTRAQCASLGNAFFPPYANVVTLGYLGDGEWYAYDAPASARPAIVAPSPSEMCMVFGPNPNGRDMIVTNVIGFTTNDSYCISRCAPFLTSGRSCWRGSRQIR